MAILAPRAFTSTSNTIYMEIDNDAALLSGTTRLPALKFMSFDGG